MKHWGSYLVIGFNFIPVGIIVIIITRGGKWIVLEPENEARFIHTTTGIKSVVLEPIGQVSFPDPSLEMTST